MNLIFDFDGTLANTPELYVKITNEYFSKLGIKPIDLSQVRKKGVMGVISESGIKKYHIPKLILYGRNKINKLIDEISLFDEIPRVIEELTSSHNLGILTTNSEENVRQVMKRYNLTTCFHFIYSELELFGKHKKLKKITKKYNIKKSDAVYIGDESRDILAAKKISLTSIGVSWGFESKEILSAADPNIILDKPTELLEISQKLATL